MRFVRLLAISVLTALTMIIDSCTPTMNQLTPPENYKGSLPPSQSLGRAITGFIFVGRGQGEKNAQLTEIRYTKLEATIEGA